MGVPGNANTLLLKSAAAGGAYEISRSLRFSPGDSSFLSRTPASATNQQTWTWSAWVKRSALATQQIFFDAYTSQSDTGYLFFGIGADDKLFISGWNTVWKRTTQVFRDPSAWLCLTVAFDVTQATGTNRIKFFVNGTQITTFDTDSAPSQNTNHAINGAYAHNIGRYSQGPSQYFSGYLADVFLIDGQALDPSSFTTTDLTTGQLIPKAYTGSYGTNGFKLNFSDNSTAAALGTDTSGNGNTWTVNNFSVTAGVNNDSLTDTPTSYETDTGAGGEVRGNYATLNALDTANTLSNGNLQLNNPSTGFKGTRNTVGMSSGKWYFECAVTAISSRTNTAPALYKPNSTLNTGGGSYGNTYISIAESPANTLNITLDGWSSTVYSQAGSLPAGTIVGIAFDADSGKIWFSIDGTWLNSGNPAAGTGAVYSSIPAGTYFFGGYAYSTSDQLDFNFGQRAFAYNSNRSGFKAVCDTNLPAPVVAKPNTVMDVVLYTGTGAALTPTSSLGFNPDWIWIKSRSAATDHALYDVVRGAQARLESNTTDAEVTTDGGVTAFNSAGFTLGTLAQVNTSSATYAAWCWDAGTSTVTNTAGSITSSVRANASAGFSIVTYTGTGSNATVGHGLGVAPSLLICKGRQESGSNGNWLVYHSSLGNTKYLILNATDAEAASGGAWNNTSPTSSVFSIGTFTGANSTGGNVCYAFSPVAGYSSMSSFVGNGSSDGPFCFTGFRPRWIILKNASAAAGWYMFDAVRNPYNLTTQIITANTSSAEYTDSDVQIDILSNGFKLRSAGGQCNGSSNVIVYAAFAESPLQYARAR